MKELSILIPARNEEFLSKTIDDILEHIEADTEVIAVLDGEWSNPQVPQNERVNIIYVPESVGQRAATNLGFRLSSGKYIMKVDAHCAFDQGFDRKMIEAFEKVDEEILTIVPLMKNLWAFDWKCYNCGKRIYQDKVPKCPVCGNDMKRKMLWRAKPRPNSTSYCFDARPSFTYFGDYKKRDKYKEDRDRDGLTETMSLQGSCFMMTRKQYETFSEDREELGSWGHEGIEIACKTWLSGGRVLCNHNTWYAHLFRTKAGVFGFPWPVSGRKQRDTKKRVWEKILNGKMVNQKYPPSWLVERFWPVKDWEQKDLDKLKKEEKKP